MERMAPKLWSPAVIFLNTGASAAGSTESGIFLMPLSLGTLESL